MSKYANIQWLPTDFQFVCIAFCPHKMPCKLFWRNFGTLHNGYTLFLLAFFSSSQEVVSSSEGATMQYQPMAWSVQCYISRLKLWSIQSMIIDIKSRNIKRAIKNGKKKSYLYLTPTKENLFLKSKAFITFSLRNIMMIFRPKNAPSTYPPAGKE